MAYKYYNNLLLIILALLISVFLNQDRVIRTFFNDNDKHAVPIASSRTFLGDEYYYYGAATDSLKLGLVSKDKVYSTNNILFGSLVSTGLINVFCQNLIGSSDIAVLVSLILQTFLLVLATIYAVKIIGRYDNKQSLWLGFWAFITLILTDYFILNSYEGAVHLRTLLSYYPNILRVVNPQMGWAFGLFYFAVLFSYLEKDTLFRFLFLLVLSLVFSSFSPSLCLTMLLTMTIMFIWNYLISKTINYFYLTLIICLFISFLFNYAQLHNFQTSAKGLEIGTGVINGIVFKPHYFIFLFLILPIVHYYKDKSLFLLASLLISSITIAAFCETMHLGERLWIRGAGLYVWLICIILISNWLKGKRDTRVFSAIGILFLSLWTYYLLPHQFDNDYGYIKTDKWIMLDWINRNIPSNSVIMSEDLEFSFLLPIYTLSKPFIPLFGQSSLSIEDTVKRYYYTLEQYGTKEQVRRNLKSFSIQKSIQNLQTVNSGKELDDNSFTENVFFNYVIYYPFTKFSASVFSSKEQTDDFFSILDKWSTDQYSEQIQPDYIIIKPVQLPRFNLNTQVVFKTDKYILLTTNTITK